MDNQATLDKQILLESRLTRVESSTTHIQDDVKDIKRSVAWLTTIVLGMNGAILTVVTKAFGMAG